MKKLILFFVIPFYSLFVIGQNNKADWINRELLKIKSLPTLEQKGDSVYWSVVKEGIQIIPDLINNLDNNQNTSIPVYFFGGTYTIADICYQIITDIILEIPTLKLISKSGCTDPDDGFWNYWLYLRKDITNRKHFKQVVNDWFIRNRDRLIWFKTTDHKYQSEDNTFINPAGGYYKLRKDFKKLKCGLFINGNGDLGYETYDRTYELQGGKKIKRYLTYVYNADTLSTLNSDIKEMKFVVDTSSFGFLNGIYFKDKNHIYVFYPMSDGGTIEINWYSDIKTFKVIKGGYGIDKRYVYYMGNIVRDADPASFNVFQSKDLNQYAYDKFNFYSGDIKLSMEEVKKLGLYNKK